LSGGAWFTFPLSTEQEKRLIFLYCQYTPYFFVGANGSPFFTTLSFTGYYCPRLLFLEQSWLVHGLYRLLVSQPKKGKGEGKLSDNDQ
jgi:hypothetical protein